MEVAGVVVNNSSCHYSGNRGGPERARSIREISEEAKNNEWRVFENQIPFSTGFPKIMRGDFRHRGDASQYTHFAREFFDHLNLDATR